MERQEIFEKVRAIVAEELGVDQKEVGWDFPLFEAIRNRFNTRSPFDVFNPYFISFLSDGLDEVEICMKLEEEFSIEIYYEKLMGILTVQHAVNYIKSVV